MTRFARALARVQVNALDRDRHSEHVVSNGTARFWSIIMNQPVVCSD